MVREARTEIPRRNRDGRRQQSLHVATELLPVAEELICTAPCPLVHLEV